MKNDPIRYWFTLYSPDSLLWWLLITCFLGCLITGGALVQISKFITGKDGKRISLLKWQGMGRVSKLDAYLSNFNEKGLSMIHKSLVVDYAFMPFLYLLMASISGLLLRHSAAVGEGWKHLLYLLCWLPFFTWLFDAIENALALSILGHYRNEFSNMNKSQVVLMSLSSFLKWITGLGWVLLMIALLISYLVSKYL